MEAESATRWISILICLFASKLISKWNYRMYSALNHKPELLLRPIWKSIVKSKRSSIMNRKQVSMFNPENNKTMSSKKKQKQKPMSEAEYIETFCQEKRIHNRYAVYVSRETHALLMKAVGIFHDRYATAMSMADAILRHHFEENRELLNRLYNEDMAASLSTHEEQQIESDYEYEPD